jgi:enoyl-[acyl-carrier protein] reductase/trans-2-enoyl-CoA reductase (NAD+)
MAIRNLRPRGLGSLLLDAHPPGCSRAIDDVIAGVPPPGPAARRPVVLVIGSSAGYGLAMAVAALFGQRAAGIGLCFERPASERMTASAGWYRSVALAQQARAAGLDFTILNADCFTPGAKQAVMDVLSGRYGRIDYLVYSVAAPRRADPHSGVTYQSVIKPVGAQQRTKSLRLGDGAARVHELTVEPASEAEVAATVKVMGGEDWSEWVRALASADLLAPGFQTVALSYVGSDLTSPIYRLGTIGRAKDHLEATAAELTQSVLRSCRGSAVTSVNGAAVTQASAVIPGLSLYISILRAVTGTAMESPLRQSLRLWDHLTGTSLAPVDPQGRIRLDTWELGAAVQAAVHDRWAAADTGTLAAVADAGWYQDEILRLYGFAVPGVDYDAPVETDVPWPDSPAVA